MSESQSGSLNSSFTSESQDLSRLGAYLGINTLGSIFLYLKKRSVVTFNLSSHQTMTFSILLILGNEFQCYIEHI